MNREGAFRSALLDPAQPAPPGLHDGRGGTAARRFAVYRNNVTRSLTEALEQTFPIVRKLIGAENFGHVARAYLRAHPPASPILSRCGESFPGFLEGFAPLAHLGYLPDVARLERALVDSYHAADAPAFDPAILSRTPPEALPALRLRLAPAVRLLQSAWPIHGIWRFNTEAPAPQPPHEAQDVLITRPRHDPIPRLLPRGGAGFIAALGAGAPLGEAAQSATETAPDFDLSALLALLLADGAIAAATPGDPG